MDFQFKPLAQSPERLNVISAKLGPDANTKYTDKDKKKAVKMGTVSNYVLCADGDELDGFIDNIDGGGTAGGFSFGGVARGNVGFRVEAQVAAGAVAVTLGALVVAGTQLPVGTEGLPQIKAGAPTLHKYRVINLYTGAGAAGTTVLLEKV